MLHFKEIIIDVFYESDSKFEVGLFFPVNL